MEVRPLFLREIAGDVLGGLEAGDLGDLLDGEFCLRQEGATTSSTFMLPLAFSRIYSMATLASSMAWRLRKLREHIRGWMGYFGISEYHKPLPPLDQWICRRVRMCYWKMWKRPRKRFRELSKLGLDDGQIKRVVGSSKGYWCRSEAEKTARSRR